MMKTKKAAKLRKNRFKKSKLHFRDQECKHKEINLSHYVRSCYLTCTRKSYHHNIPPHSSELKVIRVTVVFL